MEKGRNKKAFTLVESIVIITILVILVTIGFIAFGKNTQYAKNTKVVSDIENISKKVNIKVVEEKGITLRKLLSGTGIITNKHLSGTGVGIKLTASNYNVGTIKFSILQEDNNKFKDSNNNNYIYGYLGSFIYQVAGKIIDVDLGIEKALVRGSFYNISGDTIDGLIKEYNGTGSVVNNGTKLPY